jgi:hypothetical protein
VGEKVSDFTQLMRSAAGNVDQFLLSSSRVRCSLARQLVNLSLGVWPYAIEAAARQLSVTSQLGTLSAPAARVRRAEASVGPNEMPSAEAAAMAIINRRNMTISKMACNLSYKPFQIPCAASKPRPRNAKLIDWLDEITADCAKKRAANMNDLCGARGPQLPTVL